LWFIWTFFLPHSHAQFGRGSFNGSTKIGIRWTHAIQRSASGTAWHATEEISHPSTWKGPAAQVNTERAAAVGEHSLRPGCPAFLAFAASQYEPCASRALVQAAGGELPVHPAVCRRAARPRTALRLVSDLCGLHTTQATRLTVKQRVRYSETDRTTSSSGLYRMSMRT